MGDQTGNWPFGVGDRAIWPGSRKAPAGTQEVLVIWSRPREVRRRKPTGYPGPFRVRAANTVLPLTYTPNWNVF
jgi:hypothetical protein